VGFSVQKPLRFPQVVWNSTAFSKGEAHKTGASPPPPSIADENVE
jgi:hypothetical protein